MSELDVAMVKAATAVAVQRDRAYERFGDSSMGGSRMSRTERLAVLMEEVGETANEVVKELRNASALEPDRHGAFDPQLLIDELAQVAACAVMWIESELRAAAASLPVHQTKGTNG